MDVKAVRGAVQVVKDNTDAMCEAVHTLFRTLCNTNDLREEQIISIHFTVTPDLQSSNPATCLRHIGYQFTPMLCMQEAMCIKMLPRVVRVLLTIRCINEKVMVPVYLGNTKQLRPDI